jgi:hypothetical protein
MRLISQSLFINHNIKSCSQKRHASKSVTVQLLYLPQTNRSSDVFEGEQLRASSGTTLAVLQADSETCNTSKGQG